MADHFTNFSLVLPLPNKEAQTYATELARQAESVFDGDEIPAGFPSSLTDVCEDWWFETESESHGIWLHSTNGGIDAVCAFIQHLLERFDPCGSVSLEWSHDCSKPRADAFGGGAAFITAHNIETLSTGTWLQQQAEAHKKKGET